MDFLENYKSSRTHKTQTNKYNCTDNVCEQNKGGTLSLEDCEKQCKPESLPSDKNVKLRNIFFGLTLGFIILFIALDIYEKWWDTEIFKKKIPKIIPIISAVLFFIFLICQIVYTSKSINFSSSEKIISIVEIVINVILLILFVVLDRHSNNE